MILKTMVHTSVKFYGNVQRGQMEILEPDVMGEVNDDERGSEYILGCGD